MVARISITLKTTLTMWCHGISQEESEGGQQATPHGKEPDKSSEKPHERPPPEHQQQEADAAECDTESASEPVITPSPTELPVPSGGERSASSCSLPSVSSTPQPEEADIEKDGGSAQAESSVARSDAPSDAAVAGDTSPASTESKRDGESTGGVGVAVAATSTPARKPSDVTSVAPAKGVSADAERAGYQVCHTNIFAQHRSKGECPEPKSSAVPVLE